MTGFLIAVEIRFVDEGIGCGVFSVGFVEKGTLLWIPSMVKKYSPKETSDILQSMSKNGTQEWLRQAFVLANEPDFLCVNVDDDGRYVNHSSNPNSGFASALLPCVALRDILAGEEITCDYAGLGSPQWYKTLCDEYGVLPTDEVARRFS